MPTRNARAERIKSCSALIEGLLIIVRYYLKRDIASAERGTD